MNDKNEVLIQVQDLKKAFGKLEVLRGISTEIKKGEVVVVIGPSGSGKSTFLRSLNLLEVPTGGTVLFEGTDITDPKTDIDVHRQKIGMVFQHFHLFPHKTILENIMLAPVTLKKDVERRGREKSKRTAAEGWTCRQGRCISGSAFRWTETAYCDRAVSGNESGCDVVR